MGCLVFIFEMLGVSFTGVFDLERIEGYEPFDFLAEVLIFGFDGDSLEIWGRLLGDEGSGDEWFTVSTRGFEEVSFFSVKNPKSHPTYKFQINTYKFHHNLRKPWN